MAEAGFSLFSSSHYVRKHLVIIGITVNIAILGIFLVFYFRTNTLIHKDLLSHTQALFNEISITRQWIASHEEMYVPMKKGDTVNPWLETIPGIKTTLKDTDGRAYILKNPALATREMSELAKEQKAFHFRVTSLNPLNPDNSADSFEKKALLEFQKGATEWHEFENNDEGYVFRFIAPIVTRDACLKCHAHQGYKKGDIRGAISVTIPAASFVKSMKSNRTNIVLSVLGVTSVITFTIFFIACYFIRDLNYAEKKLLELATTDTLTGLLNRREGFARMKTEWARTNRLGGSLCVMMLDIDHFKSINDTWGHPSGDKVLSDLADILKKTLRVSDIVMRYGGEEFLAILPDTSEENLKGMAERIRSNIESHDFRTEKNERLKVTASIGLAIGNADESCESLIGRADSALYNAKNNGRNIVWFYD